MQSQTGNEPRKRKGTQYIQKQDSAGSEQDPIHCQPVSPGDDLQARIINRAYALYTERGYRQGYASTIGWRQSGKSSVSNVTHRNSAVPVLPGYLSRRRCLQETVTRQHVCLGPVGGGRSDDCRRNSLRTMLRFGTASVSKYATFDAFRLRIFTSGFLRP